MSGTHFYLTLPSNASVNIFPNNKTTSYRVKLPKVIDLGGDWEVGLYSISYPNTWYTLQNNHDTHIYCIDKNGHPETIEIGYGHYETLQSLIKATNKALTKNVGDNVKMMASAFTEKVTVQLKNGYRLLLNERMSIVFGFGKKDAMITKTSESPYVADLSAISTIYVYCDIVQPQVVGNTSAQLLRSIPAEGKFGDVITKTFTNIQYVPAQTKSFENVEILLRDDTGNPVPFERGKVVVTLHFKQLSSPYFV